MCAQVAGPRAVTGATTGEAAREAGEATEVAGVASMGNGEAPGEVASEEAAGAGDGAAMARLGGAPRSPSKPAIEDFGATSVHGTFLIRKHLSSK